MSVINPADCSGKMARETQVSCAIEEGMKNIARAIFGENLEWDVICRSKAGAIDRLEVFSVQLNCTSIDKLDYCLEADVPVRHSDDMNYFSRIDDVVFAVKANGWAQNIRFEAWCEHNPYNGAMTLVKQGHSDLTVRWLVAESLDGEVLYRGSFDGLFPWAKKIVRRVWSSP